MSTYEQLVVVTMFVLIAAAKGRRKEEEEEEERANCRCFMPSVWWPKEPVVQGINPLGNQFQALNPHSIDIQPMRRLVRPKAEYDKLLAPKLGIPD